MTKPIEPQEETALRRMSRSPERLKRKEWRARMYKEHPLKLAEFDLIYWTWMVAVKEREVVAQGVIGKLRTLFSSQPPEPSMPQAYYEYPWGEENDDAFGDMAVGEEWDEVYETRMFPDYSAPQYGLDQARQMVTYAQVRIANGGHKLLSPPLKRLSPRTK